MDQALFAVVTEAYLHEMSTRKVDDLVKALWSKPVSPGPTSTRSSSLFGFGAGKTPTTTCLAACADPDQTSPARPPASALSSQGVCAGTD
jgi:hypothetical protein